jgi:hypothetical protein
MNAVVVIQRLLTRWEKSGRAHPVASARNSLPSALELPSAILGGPVAYHSVTFDQRANFVPRITHDETRASPPQHDCGLSVSIQDGRLLASFQWEQDCGAPRRNGGLSTRLFELPLGKSGRLVHNGRFTPEYSWTYQQVIVNVGLFAPATVASFLHSEPTALVDLRADLW